MTVATATCLNCGATLTGKFCAECGQRDMPPYPTMREAVSDAWHEFSGWDGRLAATIMLLFSGPGLLTLAALQGQRNRYIKPLRLYLAASILYFFVRAIAPDMALVDRRATVPGQTRDIRIDLSQAGAIEQLSPEDRAALDENLKDAPRYIRPMMQSVLEDPAGFQRRIIENMPRAFFILVPGFAGVLALLFRKRRYIQHLLYSLHLFTFGFIALTVGEAAKYTGSLGVVATVQILAWIAIITYTLKSLRRVYGESWARTLVKSAGLAVLYLLIWIPVMLALVAWAVLWK